MTDRKGIYNGYDDKKVRLTLGETVIVGTVGYVSPFYDVMDVEIDGTDIEITVEPEHDWQVEVIVPPKPKAEDLPRGTVVAYPDGTDRLIKIAADAWVVYGGDFRVGKVPTYTNQQVDQDGYEEVVSE